MSPVTRAKTLLDDVLANWGCPGVQDPYAAKVVFVERGLPAPPGEYPHLVWLTTMPIEEGHALVTPISLVELFHLLEEELFPSPRQHIRVSVDSPADILVDGIWSESRLISLSDRSGRLACERELPRKQKLTVEVKLAGRVLRLPAEALYCVPLGDTSGREKL